MRALPLAHLVGYDAADPDDRDHQPVRERPLIQLDAEALYSHKKRTCWFGLGLARPVVGEELVPRALLCVDPWRMGMTGRVELLPQASGVAA